ncbi:hypothetical protein [Polyangium sp. 6x1]|uniref:hypothetical protein n=1 Tax=Polyangium sp. 6x1 TaxID=3042689 RepID=UPI002482645B|nr:hypothetical protein [Polyangium sp. 6x1]MDI1446343.1 hypothetical protein [Polyangium sp. 6x1]
MRTEVKIDFDGACLMGDPHSLMRAVGCGPDVVEVFGPVLKRLPICVTLDDSDARLPRLLELFKQHGVEWSEYRRDRYTDDEIQAARLIVMDASDLMSGIFAGPRVGTQYDMSEACKLCGAGARQTSAMVVDGERLQVLEGKRATTTWYNDILVEEKLAGALAESGATGLSFRGVFAAFEKRGHFQLPWRQLCATHTLPPMSPRSTGTKLSQPCPCGRSCFGTFWEVPPRLAYRASDLADARDVNVTWEWFGSVNFNGDVYDSVLAYPWFLVTPKVWRIFRDAGVTGFDWLPIRIEDG